MLRHVFHNRIALLAVGMIAGAGWATYAQGGASNFDRWWTPQNEALTVAPQHHRLVFENDQVRLLEVTIKAGVKEPFHAHRHPSLLFDDVTSHVVEHFEDGTKIDRGTRPTGAARWLPIDRPHAIENIGKNDVRIIRFELKNSR